MECVTGGIAAMCAGVFTNPLEVVKTRMQLQGELRKRGQYKTHYRNFVHAFYVIGRTEGVLALQKGLAPALVHQLCLNGIRLGGFQAAEERKWNLKENGEVSFTKTMTIAAVAGIAGSGIGSPLYLAKTRLQSQSAECIAVGTQHNVTGTLDTLYQVLKSEGFFGLWRGAVSSMVRLAVGSAGQLATFSEAKRLLAENTYHPIERGFLNTAIASMLGGVVIAVTMGPFDVICTRLYNQGVDSRGKGVLYSGYIDCVVKIFKKEGLSGFYKGIGPCFMRVGPHTVLLLSFWDQLKRLQHKYWDNPPTLIPV